MPCTTGGKQPGGWFLGSNDALCHNRGCAERSAYDELAGLGKWSAGSTLDLMLDMDAHELWISLDGSPPVLAFDGLPAALHPAVSLRAPGALAVRFRSSSWLS